MATGGIKGCPGFVLQGIDQTASKEFDTLCICGCPFLVHCTIVCCSIFFDSDVVLSKQKGDSGPKFPTPTTADPPSNHTQTNSKAQGNVHSKTFSKDAANARKANATKATRSIFDSINEHLQDSADMSTGAAKNSGLRQFSSDSAKIGRKGPGHGVSTSKKKSNSAQAEDRYTALFVESSRRVEEGSYLMNKNQCV